MKPLTLAIALAVLATGCAGAEQGTPRATDPDLNIQPTGTPYVRVEAGPVSGLVPSEWSASPVAPGPRAGFLASPHPGGWNDHDLPRRGIAATWVDATEIGVASDVYYLAAAGPAIGSLVSEPGCRLVRERVIADHAPTFLAGERGSPGDYVALGDGVCAAQSSRPTRWSYFVAAPGYGPAMHVGIPGSGLYVAAAIAPAERGARSELDRLLRGVRFGGARIADFVDVLRVSRRVANV